MELNFFDPIKLVDMDKVKLMNRTDKKYWFHSSHLPDLLDSIKEDYLLLHIDGESKLPYSTTYYDTTLNKMYNTHHNGKLNRFKIRRRKYVKSGVSFLEIKFKNNKGRTIKTRISSDKSDFLFSELEDRFLMKNSPFNSADLAPSLENEFIRLTLVNKNFKERCTIDLNIKFRLGQKFFNMGDLVIVEIKSSSNSNNSPLALALRNKRIKTSGFSKYCVGRTIVDGNLKRNAFKEKIRRIEKVTKSTNNLYNNN